LLLLSFCIKLLLEVIVIELEEEKGSEVNLSLLFLSNSCIEDNKAVLDNLFIDDDALFDDFIDVLLFIVVVAIVVDEVEDKGVDVDLVFCGDLDILFSSLFEYDDAIFSFILSNHENNKQIHSKLK
jgi:hypothetical protein